MDERGTTEKSKLKMRSRPVLHHNSFFFHECWNFIYFMWNFLCFSMMQHKKSYVNGDICHVSVSISGIILKLTKELRRKADEWVFHRKRTVPLFSFSPAIFLLFSMSFHFLLLFILMIQKIFFMSRFGYYEFHKRIAIQFRRDFVAKVWAFRWKRFLQKESQNLNLLHSIWSLERRNLQSEHLSSLRTSFIRSGFYEKP